MIISLLLMSGAGFAQDITFYSSEFENGVKTHLGLGENDNVSAARTDTITDIDLSGLGISDVRDALWLPNVRRLDLSDNLIEDIAPLARLDSLRELNIAYNKIKNANVLTFSNSPEMYVDLAFNNITDFSLFYTFTSCRFTLMGEGMQNDDSPYCDVWQFYCDAVGNSPLLCCKVESDMADAAQVSGAGNSFSVATDCKLVEQSLSVDGTDPVEFRLAVNDSVFSTTWLLPVRILQLDAGASIRIETGLPADYFITGISNAEHGTATTDSIAIEYTAGKDFQQEEVLFSYSCGGLLKGYSKVILTTDPSGIDMATADGAFKVSQRSDGSLHLSMESSQLSAESKVRIFDISGRLISEEVVKTPGGKLDHNVRTDAAKVVVVQLSSGGRSWIEKVRLK